MYGKLVFMTIRKDSSDQANSDQADRTNVGGADSPHFRDEDEGGNVEAWEEVAEGRFMPRRVRGSCTGRALG